MVEQSPAHPTSSLGGFGSAGRGVPPYAGPRGFHFPDKLLAAQKTVLTRNPDHLTAHVELARLYNELGREEEARAEEAAARRLNSKLPLELLRVKAALKKEQAEPEGFFARSSAHLKAFGYLMGGNAYLFRFTQEANAQAQQMWERAIELDPQLAVAHTVLGYTYLFEWGYQWSQDPQTLERALALARRALALDDASPVAHQLLGTVYLVKNQPERAVVEAERAIALDPDDADGYRVLGSAYALQGRPEDGIGVLEKGLRLKPRIPAGLLSALGWAYSLTGRHEEAVDALKKALSLTPNWLPTHVYLAVIYSELGRKEEARAEAAEILKLSPKSSVESWRQRFPFKDPAEAERFVAALRKAGLM